MPPLNRGVSHQHACPPPKQEHVLSASSHNSRIDTNVYESMVVRGKVRGGEKADASLARGGLV